jgi:hypothetical protein
MKSQSLRGDFKLFPDHQSESIQLKFIFEFDKIDKYEIISPLDLSNVWVRDKHTDDVSMWRRDTENQDIDHQESLHKYIYSFLFLFVFVLKLPFSLAIDNG